MKTVVLKVETERPSPDLMSRAGNMIREGRLVVFPTETVYGLAANALDDDAVRRVFDVKGRPAGNPLPVQVASIEDVGRLAVVTQIASKLFVAFSPGPLTIVLRAKPRVSDLITSGTGKVGIRIPDHLVALALIRAAGVPIVAPSANPSGEPPPTSAQEALAYLNGKVDIVIDAGPTKSGVASTVVDATADPPRILRDGEITAEMIATALTP